MAQVLILGGGFGGPVAAERLSETLGEEHRITLVSRADRFVFHPAPVRLAFGECEPEDSSFYLRKDLSDGGGGTAPRGRFRGWAKRAHEKYWEARHA